MGQRHVRVLGELGLAAITVDPVAEGATYRTLDEVTESIDLACIAVPIPELADVAVDVIGRLRPRIVLIEKPGAPNSAELSRVNDAASARNVRVVIGYTERFNPVVRVLSKLLKDGKVPSIEHVVATRFSPDAALAPVIPHEIDLAVHDIDIAWRYARGASVSWFGGHAPVRQRQFTCIHSDGNATVLDLDNRLINGVQVRAEEPLKREWRYAMNLSPGHVPLWPEVEVLEAAEKMAQREMVAA
jgi:predicted dehydrogenase